MGKYATYLDLGVSGVEEYKLGLFPLLDPTLQYSSTPTLLIYTRGNREAFFTSLRDALQDPHPFRLDTQNTIPLISNPKELRTELYLRE